MSTSPVSKWRRHACGLQKYSVNAFYCMVMINYRVSSLLFYILIIIKSHNVFLNVSPVCDLINYVNISACLKQIMTRSSIFRTHVRFLKLYIYLC